jgi:glyoxylase-like metal-dependent hydrolase (beta-lactamase superfamily II)
MTLPEGVHSIGPPEGGLVRGGYAHAYLFEDGEELTLVDTLWDDDAYLILEYIWRLGRTPRDLKHIALTHAHRSHLGGLATLQALSGAKVYAHQEEAPIIEGTARAAPVRLSPLRPLPLLPFRVLALIGIPKHVPCRVDRRLTSRKDPRVGPLEVIPTPGHTPGHLAFFHPCKSVLIAGDAVATWPAFGAGWPGFNQDDDLYLDSLESLLTLEAQYIGTGHGEPLDDAREKLASLVPSAALADPTPSSPTA